MIEYPMVIIIQSFDDASTMFFHTHSNLLGNVKRRWVAFCPLDRYDAVDSVISILTIHIDSNGTTSVQGVSRRMICYAFDFLVDSLLPTHDLVDVNQPLPEHLPYSPEFVTKMIEDVEQHILIAKLSI